MKEKKRESRGGKDGVRKKYEVHIFVGGVR
jgi:hypothetical protein